MRISVVADSLGLPRIAGDDVVLYHDSWPYLLEKYLRESGDVTVVNKSRRALMSEELNIDTFYECIELVHPSHVVIQVGVVDSMPRIISRKEKHLLAQKLFPGFLSKMIISYRSKRRAAIIGRSPLRKVYVKPENYKRFVKKFVKKIQEFDPSIAITLIPTLINKEIMEKKSPGAWKNASLYNDILKEIAVDHNAVVIDANSFYEKHQNPFCDDGYHLNKAGNEIIARMLVDSIKERKIS